MSENPKQVRCAVYTRKSTNAGLDSDFNSLDAQREAAEAYVLSQKAAGWILLQERYDDGGYSGGTLDRPAFRHLLGDVCADKVDCIIVYKIDRLSRSLADFINLMSLLEEREVSLVSVTQHLNTATSMGRLILNVLFSFAQFEREITADRVSDKIRAARRRGKWTGGRPALGYDVVRDAHGARLVVNKAEARRVRSIFEHYLLAESTRQTADWVDQRGWTTKHYLALNGHYSVGKPYATKTIHTLLTNPLYVGLVTLKGKVYKGEHKGIVHKDIFGQVQAMLRLLGRQNGKLWHSGKRQTGLLRGWIRCASCGVALTHEEFSPLGCYYQCRGRADHCDARLRVSDVELLVVRLIRRMCRQYSSIGAFACAAREKLRQEIAHRLRCGKEQWRRINGCAGRRLNRDGPGGVTDPVDAVFRSDEFCKPYEDVVMLTHRERCIEGLDTIEQPFNEAWPRLEFTLRRRLVRLCTKSITYDHIKKMLCISLYPYEQKVVRRSIEFRWLRHRRRPGTSADASE